MNDAVDKDAVAVVYVRPQDIMEVSGCTWEEAQAWLSDERNLGKIRAAVFPDPFHFDEALTKAYDGQ